jgi:hypothetical protein
MHHIVILKKIIENWHNDTLDEAIFAHINTLNIHKILRLKNMSWNIFTHEILKQLLITLNCNGENYNLQQMHFSCHAKVIKVA